MLDELEHTNEGIRLSWSKLLVDNFEEYRVIRYVDYSDDSEVIGVITDKNVASFTDNSVPYSELVTYKIVGVLKNRIFIESNAQLYHREGDLPFEFVPFDVKIDTATDYIYVFEKENGTISIIDYNSLQIVKSITTGGTIGYSSFGVNGTVKELYVPRNDGWVFVYNAKTLEKIDQINVGGILSCVEFNNGLLYVSTSGYADKPLRVFSRETKLKINQQGWYDQTRFKVMPDSNTELIEITINVGPTQLSYFNFDNNGNLITNKEDGYHGDHPLDAGIFQIFPTGVNFITAKEGAIYTKGLIYVGQLPRGTLEFSDFAFSSNTIFAASNYQKLIVEYSITSYVELKRYTTKFVPFKIFREKNSLIYLGIFGSGFVIEKIELN